MDLSRKFPKGKRKVAKNVSQMFIILYNYGNAKKKTFDIMSCLTKQLTTNTGGNVKKVKEASFTVGVIANWLNSSENL